MLKSAISLQYSSTYPIHKQFKGSKYVILFIDGFAMDIIVFYINRNQVFCLFIHNALLLLKIDRLDG